MEIKILILFLGILNSTISLQNFTKSECKNSKVASNFFKEFKYENLTSECEKSMKVYENGLKEFEVWAMKMLDSSSKPPPSILNGNLPNFGDFDACISLKPPNDSFNGKYCLSSIMFEIPKSFNQLKHKILGGNTFASEFEDVSHITAKSSEIKWAVCVPSTCGVEDVKIILDENLSEILKDLPIKIKIQVKEEMCQVKNEDFKFKGGSKVVIILLGIYIAAILGSTYAETFLNFDNKLTTALSLKSNLKDFLSTRPIPNDMPSLHFFRSFFSIILFFAHKAFEVYSTPYTNKYQVSELFKNSSIVIFRNSHLHTDVFLMISGFLVAHSVMKKRQKGEKIQFLKENLNRYLRLMPNVAFLVIFMIFIAPHIGSGPLWPMLQDYQANLCSKTGWWNFLMIQNLMDFEEICMMNTHHIATDFQLSIIGPIVGSLMMVFPVMTGILMISGALGVSTMRFVRSYLEGINVFVSSQTSVTKIQKIDTIFHILPHYRITPYFAGILLAFALIKLKDKKLSNFQLNCGWFVAVVNLLITTVLSLESAKESKIAIALFNSLGTISICLFIGWIIFTFEMGNRNIFSSLIEWKYWKIFGYLSYAIYLVQFPVFHYNIAKIRTASHFTVFGSFIDLNEIFMVISSALALTLFIDYPSRNIKKLLSTKQIKVKGKSN